MLEIGRCRWSRPHKLAHDDGHNLGHPQDQQPVGTGAAEYWPGDDGARIDGADLCRQLFDHLRNLPRLALPRTSPRPTTPDGPRLQQTHGPRWLCLCLAVMPRRERFGRVAGAQQLRPEESAPHVNFDVVVLGLGVPRNVDPRVLPDPLCLWRPPLTGGCGSIDRDKPGVPRTPSATPTAICAAFDKGVLGPTTPPHLILRGRLVGLSVSNNLKLCRSFAGMSYVMWGRWISAEFNSC